MDKRGFTLVEVISVIALLGLIIGLAVPGVMRSSKKAKERTLNTKVKNIEKAAVLYGQDHKNMISKKINHEDTSNNTSSPSYIETYKYCFKEDVLIPNCYYYFDNKNNGDSSDDTTLITVGFLANDAIQGYDENNIAIKGYIKADDDSGNILNSTDESKHINDCEIQIYKKYGKIYAVYNKDDKGDSKCWID